MTIETLDVSVENLPYGLDGLKIIQMSDFHADKVGLFDGLLDQAIAASNREFPDLVVLTGDFITSKTAPLDRLMNDLKRLESRYGTYAILGNHDVYPFDLRSAVLESLSQASIQVLWNEVIYPCGPGLAIVGFADVRSREFCPSQVMPQIPPEIPRIVLAHNPDCATALKDWRVDLQLSGHTHGGQICFPGLGSLPSIAARSYRALPSRLQRRLPGFQRISRISQNWDWEQGYHAVARNPLETTDRVTPTSPNRLYTNRGLGTYPPGRLFCTPEVTRISLYRKSTAKPLQ